MIVFRTILLLIFFGSSPHFLLKADPIHSEPDFRWGNSNFYNLETNVPIFFNGNEIRLISVRNHINILKINNDTLELKTSGRVLPRYSNGLKLYASGNNYIKTTCNNTLTFSLLKKELLICISMQELPLLEPAEFTFPISFSDGFIWNGEETTSQFAFPYTDEIQFKTGIAAHPGIDFNLHSSRGIIKDWAVALENCEVAWVKPPSEKYLRNATVLLKSKTGKGIYYLYEHLYNNSLKVKQGETVDAGEAIATSWGDEKWGHLHFAVIHSDTIPTFENRNKGIINAFPQMYELYYKHLMPVTKSYNKGRILFGKPRNVNNNNKNVDSFEEWAGKGWMLGNWNPPSKVEWVSKLNDGNVRLKKRLFEGTQALSVNPLNHFDYEIMCPNGVYRIRANVGDYFLPTWQKVEFEGFVASTYTLKPGEFKWTNEWAVTVKDHRLTVRIYLDEKNNLTAGISELVFQQIK